VLEDQAIFSSFYILLQDARELSLIFQCSDVACNKISAGLFARTDFKFNKFFHFGFSFYSI